MFRTLLLTLAILTANSSVTFAQRTDTTTSGRHGTTALFEAAVGRRLNRQPDPGVQDARWYASWELGPSFNRGNWAWGATIMADVDEDGSRWGIRPRHRRWLGHKGALDLGAGILLGGQNNYAEQPYPGFAGLIGLSYGDWLGVSLELQAIRTTLISQDYYVPSEGRYVPGTRTESTDWAWIIGARMNGIGAIALSAAPMIHLLAAAVLMSGSW